MPKTMMNTHRYRTRTLSRIDRPAVHAGGSDSQMIMQSPLAINQPRMDLHDSHVLCMY